VLKHASRSRHIDPDRPPAAAGGLRSQVPDLVHGPRELLDLPPAAAGWSTRTDSLLRQEVEGGHQLGSFSYHTGPSEPQLTSSGRATRAEWLSSTHGTKCHDVTAKHTEFRRQRPDTHTEDIATRHATCGLQHQKRPYPPKPWAAVRACAVTLNTKLRSSM